MENVLFPLAVPKHVGFCIIALVFFAFQFFRQHYKYQLIMAIAAPLTLLVYATQPLADAIGGNGIFGQQKTWFYGVGLLELILLLGAIYFLFTERKRKEREEERALAAAEAAATAAAPQADDTADQEDSQT